MLELENVEVVYEDVVLVLKGVSMNVPQGSVVTLLGANGAGKTTVLRAITGLLDIHRGDVTKGTITFEGRSLIGLDAPSIVRQGIAQVMEGRRVFGELTVDENLRAGGYSTPRGAVAQQMDRVYGLFPRLKERRTQTAGLLSGGEQQMLAVGRALMCDPRLLILDEPSLGLAPLIVEQIRELIQQINEDGVTVLLVEQNAAMALAVADHGYVMETGKIVMDRPAAELSEDEDIREFYLGLREEGASSYRDVKHYKRRKRWLS